MLLWKSVIIFSAFIDNGLPSSLSTDGNPRSIDLPKSSNLTTALFGLVEEMLVVGLSAFWVGVLRLNNVRVSKGGGGLQ